MTPFQSILGKMRRLWVLERCARGALLILGLALNGLLVCLLLQRLVGVPLVTLAAVGAFVLLATGALLIRAARARPGARELARLLDERAGTSDLFASALEFAGRTDRFGWLGQLTCELARSRAAAVALRPRWSLGSRRKWHAIGASAAMLLGIYIGLAIVGPIRNAPAPGPVAAVALTRPDAPGVKPVLEQARPVEPRADSLLPDLSAPGTPPAPEPAVKITSEMIDKYLAQMPASQEVDLTGVTPIRWDADEASGKSNPQNQPAPEKIDPVKLDASLLKDLQDAKKKQEKEGGKEGGVDIAVMGDQGQTRAKGKEGGKNSGESLANAVSKDPRGDPTRMAIKPAKRGLQIRSFDRTPSKQKGDERPMGLLDLLQSLERLKSQPPHDPEGASVKGDKPADRIVRQEALRDDAGALTESYFGQLRKADR